MGLRKHNTTAGFSLLEVLVAITVLGLVIVPIGTALMLSFRLSARSEQLLQNQLSVSGAVETMLANGLAPDQITDYENRFSVDISARGHPNSVDPAYYEITVSSGPISIDTCVRPAKGGTPG